MTGKEKERPDVKDKESRPDHDIFDPRHASPDDADSTPDPDMAELFNDLREGLELLERTVPPPMTPDVRVLERKLAEHGKLMRAKLIRELTVFVLAALLLNAGLIAVLASAPKLGIAVQIAAALAGPAVLIWRRARRRVNA